MYAQEKEGDSSRLRELVSAMGPVLSRKETPEDIAKDNAARLLEIMDKMGVTDDDRANSEEEQEQDDDRDDGYDDDYQNDRDSD